MLGRWLKPLLPRSLMGRAAAILVVPVTGILILVSAGVIQRHYDRVTRQMTQELALTVTHIRDRAAADLDMAPATVAELERAFGLGARMVAAADPGAVPRLPIWELSARLVRRELASAFPDAARLAVDPGRVVLILPLDPGGAGPFLRLAFPPSRLTASNPHQLLVITLAAAVLMTLIAFLFLRNQMRPIRRLAAAAEAFGRGETVPLRISGATEVRAAGRAFLEMRDRIEAQIEQRTLMLSGVSHDLRTPLTRARLALSLMEDEPEAAAVLADLAQMEALIDRYLEFLRDGSAEPDVPTDLAALVAERVALAARDGAPVTLRPGPGVVPLRLRPLLFVRALDNVIANALRYGQRAEVWIAAGPEGPAVCIEDAGPGIPPDRRAAALRPFVRLDPARQADGGVGLGLAIAADALRGHGGRIELAAGTSPGLGGLLVRLVLPGG